MRTTILFVCGLMLITTWSFAADFSPTVMTLSAPERIEYQFIGESLTIPLTVANTPAALWLIINTHDKAENIRNVTNGFLGWHYVNKIDTTVYISQRYERTAGETEIVWDGNDQDGNLVAAGTYDYYIWAYDNITARQPVCDYVMVGFDWDTQFTHVYEVGEDGLPLAQPLLFGNVPIFINNRQSPQDQNFYQLHGIHLKWTIGGDPHDPGLLQTTRCKMYLSAVECINATGLAILAGGAAFTYGGPVLDPHDYTIFYHCSRNIAAKTDTMMKWRFVSDGEAVQDESWLGWDELTWEDNGAAIAANSQKPGCFSDRNYIYVLSPGLHQKQDEWNRLRCVSFEGDVIFDKMMHEWYMPDDPNPHGYINGSPHLMYSRGNDNWVMVTHTCCMIEMINTTRLLEDVDDDTDRIRWHNANGDYWMDAAFREDLDPNWYCLADDKTVSVRRGCLAVDSNNFTIVSVNYSGITSFGVATQDGTGIEGYMAFGDDTVSDITSRKGGALVADYGSNYDGLYMNSAVLATSVHYFDLGQTNFVAFDSFHGIITNEPVIEVDAEENAQLAFSVAQNAPNPFNPATTIAFTVPVDGNVRVDVYNVAGQKIDTLVDDIMSAGKHSVVWDASGFSNGVYFYTVKAGDFSKTLKMTLLK